jgi:hypothetical protein
LLGERRVVPVRGRTTIFSGARPVSEFFYELDVGAFHTRSGLIGAIWQVKDNLAIDFAVRGARINDHAMSEIRAGVTFAFGMSKGPGLLSKLTAAKLSGREGAPARGGQGVGVSCYATPRSDRPTDAQLG